MCDSIRPTWGSCARFCESGVAALGAVLSPRTPREVAPPSLVPQHPHSPPGTCPSSVHALCVCSLGVFLQPGARACVCALTHPAVRTVGAGCLQHTEWLGTPSRAPSHRRPRAADSVFYVCPNLPGQLPGLLCGSHVTAGTLQKAAPERRHPRSVFP